MCERASVSQERESCLFAAVAKGQRFYYLCTNKAAEGAFKRRLRIERRPAFCCCLMGYWIKGGDGGRAQINSAGLQPERARSSAYFYYHFCPNESTSDFPLLGKQSDVLQCKYLLVCIEKQTRKTGNISKANMKNILSVFTSPGLSYCFTNKSWPNRSRQRLGCVCIFVWEIS